MGPKAMFVVLILLIVGWLYLGASANTSSGNTEPEASSPSPDPSGEEWPIVAESTNETDIHPLKSLLESNDIPAMVETENPNTVEGAMSALHNRLRVPPDRQSEAVSLLQDHDQEKYLAE